MDAIYNIRSNDAEDIIDGFHFEIFIVDKLIKIFQIQYHSFTSIFFIPGEISEMNSLYPGVLWTIMFFLSSFINSAEMTSFSG